jgi:hypothetical protein
MAGSRTPAGVLYPDREHDDERFDCAIEVQPPVHRRRRRAARGRGCTAVVFNGYLLHRSLPNTLHQTRNFGLGSRLGPSRRTPSGGGRCPRRIRCIAKQTVHAPGV